MGSRAKGVYFRALSLAEERKRVACVWMFTAALFCVVVKVQGQTTVAKAAGTVKSISGNSVVLSADSGVEINVTLADSVRIVKAAPGQNDVKSMAPISASDIQAGDRILARGQSGEGSTVIASSVIVMKKSDIAERWQQEGEEWRRGVGGIVKEVNAAAGTVTLANSLVASGKPIMIHVSPSTAIRRYAPDSIKFDDAKPGTLDQIKPGDQLRARGTNNADGTEFTAQAIISGTFREIAGTVVSADAANNNIIVMDLATKKPLTLKVSPDSQMHKLPLRVAQMIAMRLKGGTPTVPQDASASGSPPSGASGYGNSSEGHQGGWRGAGASPGIGGKGRGGPGGNWRGSGGGPPDFQQMLSHMPAVSASDLQKGDVVMLVATEGSSTSEPTAITLLAGVEPILTAAPSGASARSILSPWNLGPSSAGGGDTTAQ